MNYWKATTIGLVAVLLGLIYSGETVMAQKGHRAHIAVLGGRLTAGKPADISDKDLPPGEVKGFSCITVNVRDFNGTIVTDVPLCYVLTQ